MVDPKNLKICFIAGTLTQGGAERQLYYILKSLVSLGTQVRLICLTQKEYWEQRILDLGVPVTWVGKSPFKLLRLFRILRVVRKSMPHLLQSQHFYTNLYAVAASRAAGIQGIGAIRNDARSEVRANGPLYGNLSLKTPRAIVANSRIGIRNAIELGVPAERLHLLPNVVDCQHFKLVDKKHSSTIRVITAGRLVEQKRFDRYLKILSKINKETQYTVKGVLVGEGPLKARLEDQARQLGLLPNLIQFAGATANISELYERTDVFLLTSDWEGTPNVLLEAMACGLPVVASRVGGVPDLIQHGKTGYLAGPESADSYISPLMEMIKNPGLHRRIAHNARQYISDHHSLEFLPSYLRNLYSQILS